MLPAILHASPPAQPPFPPPTHIHSAPLLSGTRTIDRRLACVCVESQSVIPSAFLHLSPPLSLSLPAGGPTSFALSFFYSSPSPSLSPSLNTLSRSEEHTSELQ